MKYSRKPLLFLLVLFVSISLFVGCTPESEDEVSEPKDVVSTEDDSKEQSELQILQGKYDKLNDDCEAVRRELEATQAKYKELQSEYSELSTKYDGLSADYDGLSTKYDGLSVDYDELTTMYNNLLEGTPDITESDVEQAIFKMINKGRQDSGLNELEPAVSFYRWAKEHSDYLATKNLVEIAKEPYWQGVFRAAGYSSLDRITNAAWMVWKVDKTFEDNFLNEHAEFGVVAVTKSGDIFYITYFAHTQK